MHLSMLNVKEEKIEEMAEHILKYDPTIGEYMYVELDKNALVTKTTKRRSGGGTSAYYTNYSQVFAELLKKNDQTVGWIQVNNTKINYPVVQAAEELESDTVFL